MDDLAATTFRGRPLNGLLAMSSISIPKGIILKILIAWLVVVAFQIGGQGWLSPSMTPILTGVCFAILIVIILMCHRASLELHTC